MTYYNEHDPFAAAWLRELIAERAIPDGYVDSRDLQSVTPGDLAGFTHCHFFAGIGGWALALELAGWPANRSVWTGSCPCQPFSVAGKRQGGTDDRHLWPYWARLIRQCRPDTIFGEQVESAIGHGWLDAVCDDLEGVDYAVGAVCLPAACVGAFHTRSRLWWVAAAPHPDRLRLQGQRAPSARTWDEQQFTRLLQDQLASALPTGRDRALAHGLPGRVGRLRGYGNAIVPQVAAEVIRAYLA